MDCDSDGEDGGIDTCPICLHCITADEAFLDRCYHRFHYKCLLRWTDTQKAHPPEAGPTYCCPLCKTAYTSILFGLEGTTFRQHWVEPQQQERPTFLTLNAQQLRRRSVYSHGQSVQPAVTSGSRKSAVAPSEVQAWIERELQAITLEHDVKIVSQVVLRTLTALDQAMGIQGNRSRTSQQDISWLTDKQQQNWQQQMTAAIQPFIPECAAQFAVQLLGFLASKLTVQGHDQAVFGELLGPKTHEAHAQQGSDRKASQHIETSGESSESRSPDTQEGGHTSGTDSEGYVSLLQVQRNEGCEILAQPMQSEGAVASHVGHQQSYDTEFPEAEGNCCICSESHSDEAADLNLTAVDVSLGCEQLTVSEPPSSHSSAFSLQKKTRRRHKTSTKHKRRKHQGVTD